MEKPGGRVYVPVAVTFDSSGRMVPRKLQWEDGQTYEIDKVLDVRPSFAARAGGQGDRYTVRIGTNTRYLFFEHNPEVGTPVTGRWFVERRES